MQIKILFSFSFLFYRSRIKDKSIKGCSIEEKKRIQNYPLTKVLIYEDVDKEIELLNYLRLNG